MASLKVAKTDEELKKMTVANIRKDYHELALDYNSMLDNRVVYCPKCGKWLSSSNFYQNKKNADNLEHWGCKRDIVIAGCDYNKATDILIDNKEKAIYMCRVLDWVFLEKVYDDQVQAAKDALGEKNRSTGWQQYIVVVQSLKQYREKTFANSEFRSSMSSEEEENHKNEQTIKNGKKRFGAGLSQEDYMFLENEYQDWVTRYECNTKTQEEIFERLCLKKWEINKATKSGQNTKDLDKTYQELMTTANIAPRQTTMDAMADAQTFGTLIQKYEETRPLPEIDPELEDVDKIGLYIDSFYRGHMSKMLGLKNRFSNIYERVMSKFTVKPPEYDEETDSEILFEKIFGSMDD